MLGNSGHFNGDLRGGRLELEAALESEPRSKRNMASYLGFEGKNLAGGIVGRNWWLQGHPAQAAVRERQTVCDAAETDHSLTLCIALLSEIAVALWSGDLSRAEEDIEWLVSYEESHSLAPYAFVGRGFGGELAVRRGNAKGGVEILRRCLEKLHAATYEAFTAALEISLVQGLAAMRRVDGDITWIGNGIQR